MFLCVFVCVCFQESAGEASEVFSNKRRSSQETFSDSEGVSSGHQSVQGKGETFFRVSDPEEAARFVLEEQRDNQLAEAKSEILKQECKVDTFNTCIHQHCCSFCCPVVASFGGFSAVSGIA